MDIKETGKKLKPFAPVLSVALVTACVAGSLSGYEAPVYAATQEETPVKKEETKEKKEEKKTAAKGSFDLEDGVYKGTGTGYAGDITVSVLIKDKQIVSIDILSSSDDAAFFTRAKAVIDKIIEGQTLDVDTVSGATFSSRGIISAVKNALTGEKDTSETGQAQSGQTGAAAGSSTSVAKVEDAAAYKDGTYYGSGTGFGGPLKVMVEISGGKIASIQIVENSDGSDYISKAASLIDSIIATQSTNVDTVSGATYSSKGLLNAIKNALKQAEKVTNGESIDEKPDLTDLKELIERAEKLEEDKYTETSWAVLQTRLADAKDALEETKQTAVDKAVEKLKTAIAQLESKDGKDEENTKYISGIYEVTVPCKPDDDEDFEEYNLTMTVTIRDDKIMAITDITGDGDSSNDRYIMKAANGTSSIKGVVSQIIDKGMPEDIDTVSRATCSSNAILEGCKKVLEAAERPTDMEAE
ncbi:MAG: FMN-binding protein [Coprococcus sp.]